MTLRGYPMAVEFSLQGTGQKISSTQRQLRICGDANRCRSPLGVRNVLRLVVLWGGGGLNRFPTNTKELVGLKKKKEKDGKCLLTLKETIKPPFVHSSTIGFKIFGTWSISIDKLPLPDCILCSDCACRRYKSSNLNTRRKKLVPFFVLVRKSR